MIRHLVYKVNKLAGIYSKNNGTDWWIMKTDGSEKKRLTYLNKKGHPHYAGSEVWAGHGSFSADGTRFIGDVQHSLFSQEGYIILVDLPTALVK